MARLPRVVVVDVPHHVTQRGNARQVILAGDADRLTYLELLCEYSELYGPSLLGYCLMSNHVHLIAVPQAGDALAQSLKQAHGSYAACWNARQSSTGHVWEGRPPEETGNGCPSASISVRSRRAEKPGYVPSVPRFRP